MKRLLTCETGPFFCKIGCWAWLITFSLLSTAWAVSDFKVVRAGQDDTLASLAQKYLNDRTKGWMIAEYNEISSVVPGREIIIPLKPFNKAGLYPDGYQTASVLSYHRFTTQNQSRSRMVVTQAAFEKQMQYLRENGYTVIKLSQLFDFLDHKDQIPQKSVVITIDDGFRSAFEIAYPILKKYGYPATFFLYTDLVGSSSAVNWDQVRELAQNGFDIQSQTVNHRDLSKLMPDEGFKAYVARIENEITLAREDIREKVASTPVYMAYPYGRWNDLVIAMLKKHGFRGALTVRRGANPFFADNFRVKRSMIYGTFDLDAFKENLKTFVEEELQ